MAIATGCGLAAETKVLAPEGALTLRAVAGKAIPVLTRDDHDHHLFRLMLNVRKIADAHPTLKVTLENGNSFRVAPEQVLYTSDMQPVAAFELRPGAALKPAYHYPKGYEYRTDAGEQRVSEQAVAVSQVEPAGEAEIFALSVRDSSYFFLDAGVLCKAEAPYDH